MNSRKILLLILALSLASIFGCSSQSENVLDQKIAALQVSGTQLDDEFSKDLAASTTLSDEQKSKMKSLRKNTLKQITEFNDAILKLKIVLIRDLLSSNFEQEEIDLIKSKVQNIEEKKMAVFLGAIKAANELMGKTETNEKIYRGFARESIR